jgi:uncharacterized protein YdeI (BOF family)
MPKKTLLLFLLLLPYAYQAQASEPPLLINEIMYDPLGSDDGLEWIELYNPSLESLNLSGYILETAGLTFQENFIFPQNTTIEAKSYLLIGEENIKEARFKTALDLQNGGSASDGIRIIDTNKKVLDTVIYDSPNSNNLSGDSQNPETSFAPAVSSGSSLCRLNFQDTNNSQQDFYECKTPSPLLINTLLDPEEAQDPEEINLEETLDDPVLKNSKENPFFLTIKEAKQKEKATWVKIQGNVTTTFQNPSSSFIYLEDSTSGIKIYSSKKDFPKLEFGQKIEVVGLISEAYQEKKINIETSNDISILSTENPLVPILFSIDSLNFDQVGKLVKVEGILEKQSGNTFYLSQNSKEIKVTLLEDSKIQKPTIEKNDSLSITGILARYNDSLKIIPRTSNDIIVQNHNNPTKASKSSSDSQNKEITKTGANLFILILQSLLLTIFSFSYLYKKKMLK